MITRCMCCASLFHCDLFDLKDVRQIFTKCLLRQTSHVNEKRQKPLYGFTCATNSHVFLLIL